MTVYTTAVFIPEDMNEIVTEKMVGFESVSYDMKSHIS